MTDRFHPPAAGAPTAVRFPEIARDALDNGLGVWAISHTSVPLVTAVLTLAHGTADDPAAQPGLASLVADLIDEGAGGYDAIELSEALMRLGSHLDIDTGADETVLTLTSLTRQFLPSMTLLADIVLRPHMSEAALARVRELRTSRLRQMSQSAGSMADRTFVAAVFRGHPYGHGAFGTTAGLESITVDDARGFWAAMAGPRRATLIVAGDVTGSEIRRVAEQTFGDWSGGPEPRPLIPHPAPPPEAKIWLVDRPDAPQSELRIGHGAPWRRTRDYHALVTLNALVGGQFTSRINRNLREEKGITYGARTAFELRRVAGSFSCDTSVQADATAVAVREVLRELSDVRQQGSVPDDELARAKASLTRGYVRHFETAGQLARAAGQLATHELDPDVFDRFVPEVTAVTPAQLAETAHGLIQPDDATIVVVGDAARLAPSLADLGRKVAIATPEF
jgi:zinc protease